MGAPVHLPPCPLSPSCQVNASKKRISELKAGVEQRRLARSMAALLRQQQGGSSGAEADEEARGQAEEEQAKGLIEQVCAVWAMDLFAPCPAQAWADERAFDVP